MSIAEDCRIAAVCENVGALSRLVAGRHGSVAHFEDATQPRHRFDYPEGREYGHNEGDGARDEPEKSEKEYLTHLLSILSDGVLCFIVIYCVLFPVLFL